MKQEIVIQRHHAYNNSLENKNEIVLQIRNLVPTSLTLINS